MSVLEPGVSVPRKSSEASSFKWVVACGIIVCIVISPIVGLYFHHHRKSPKNGVNNYSCKTFPVHDWPLFIKSNKNESGVWSWEIHAKKIKRSKHRVTALTASVMFNVARQKFQTSDSFQSNQTKCVWCKYNSTELVGLLILNIRLVVQNTSAL